MSYALNKNLVFKIIIALTSCFVFFIHQLGHELYTGNLKSQYREVTLGFVIL